MIRLPTKPHFLAAKIKGTLCDPLPSSISAELCKMAHLKESYLLNMHLAQRYPLVNSHITMEIPHAINGKTHYFYGHFQ